jgi:Fic family protein
LHELQGANPGKEHHLLDLYDALTLVTRGRVANDTGRPDLLARELGEAPGVPLSDVAEVSRYVVAMTHGLQRLREGFPLSNRLLREMHAVLLERARRREEYGRQYSRLHPARARLV